MSDKSLTTYTSRDLLVRGSKEEIENTTRKLMKLAVGWRKLNAEQAVELAVAAYITGANPFLGEIYHMGDQGITLGVAWFQRKAAEAIKLEIGRPGSVNADYRPASHEDAVFDETVGDIAWTCTITDSATHQRNFDETTKLFVLLVEKGMGADKAWDIAERKIGPAQTWEASAVVYSDEDFSGTDKQGKKRSEKWDRNERCKKRALKWAIKKRFPNMEFVSESDGDLVTIDATAKEVVREIVTVVEAAPPREDKVVITELGYDPEPPAHEPQGEPAEKKSNFARSLIVQALIDEHLAENTFSAAGMINKMPENIKADQEKVLAWARLYRAWRDSDVAPDKAAEFATQGKAPGKQTEMKL